MTIISSLVESFVVTLSNSKFKFHVTFKIHLRNSRITWKVIKKARGTYRNLGSKIHTYFILPPDFFLPANRDEYMNMYMYLHPRSPKLAASNLWSILHSHAAGFFLSLWRERAAASRSRQWPIPFSLSPLAITRSLFFSLHTHTHTRARARAGNPVSKRENVNRRTTCTRDSKQTAPRVTLAARRHYVSHPSLLFSSMDQASAMYVCVCVCVCVCARSTESSTVHGPKRSIPPAVCEGARGAWRSLTARRKSSMNRDLWDETHPRQRLLRII